jgi:hypothetical protein
MMSTRAHAGGKALGWNRFGVDLPTSASPSLLSSAGHRRSSVADHSGADAVRRACGERRGRRSDEAPCCPYFACSGRSRSNLLERLNGLPGRLAARYRSVPDAAVPTTVCRQAHLDPLGAVVQSELDVGDVAAGGEVANGMLAAASPFACVLPLG